jgi:hypothetical protein
MALLGLAVASDMSPRCARKRTLVSGWRQISIYECTAAHASLATMHAAVSGRTGLRPAEMEIEKWRAETGARNPPLKDRNTRNCQPRDGGRQPNPREWRRFSPTGKITPRRPDSLADDPVAREPVSSRNSLLTGKLTGKFADSCLSVRFCAQSISRFKGLQAQPNREFFEFEQGIESRDQGIFSVEEGIRIASLNDGRLRRLVSIFTSR